jgi:hypothetical protein
VIKLENGHRANMRKRLTSSECPEIRTAYASGIGLRELARNMGIPAAYLSENHSLLSWKP